MKNNLSQGSNSYLWFICLVASSGGLLFGYDVIVVSGVIPQVIKQYNLTPSQLGFLVSSVLWGCAIGSGLSGFLLDFFGRKKVLITAAFMLFISALWSSLAISPMILISARLIGGIGCGMATTACPPYISEVSPENKRGRMVSLYHFAVCSGIVICVFVNWGIFSFSETNTDSIVYPAFFQWFVVEQSWRAMLASEAIPGVLFLGLAFALPESPRWLIKYKRNNEAESILTKINGSQRANQICTEIRNTVRIDNELAFFNLFSDQLRKPFFLAILICIFSEACGISAVLYYGPQLFEQAGLSLGYSMGGFAILAVVNMVFNLVAIHFMDKVGRKTLLSIGATGSMISLIIIGTLYLIDQTGTLIVIFFISFIAFFAFSIGPVKFVVISEIFPNQIRGRAIAICTLFIWITSAIVAQFFPIMRDIMHTGYIFFFFAADIMLLLIFVKFLLPETKGLTMEEIERRWLLIKE